MNPPILELQYKLIYINEIISDLSTFPNKEIPLLFYHINYHEEITLCCLYKNEGETKF
jgi:hypothetical protein